MFICINELVTYRTTSLREVLLTLPTLGLKGTHSIMLNQNTKLFQFILTEQNLHDWSSAKNTLRGVDSWSTD